MILFLSCQALCKNKSVTVFVDVIYVNKIVFFTSIARDLKLRTYKMVVNKKSKTQLDEIQKVVRKYKLQSFNLHTLFIDNEFLPLEGALADMGIILNTLI